MSSWRLKQPPSSSCLQETGSSVSGESQSSSEDTYLLYSSLNSMMKEELRESGFIGGGRTLWMLEWLRELKEGQGEISCPRGGGREVEGSRDWSAQALQGR